MKLMTVVAASVCAVSLSAQAAEETSAEKPELAEAEETKIFEAGFDFDFLSAYVDKNAVANDNLVMQPCVWADLTCFEPFWLGFSIWQNYDLTDRRRSLYRYGLNETDYNVHLGATAWESEDEDYSLGFELGHDWFTYHGVRTGLKDASPDTSEVYLKATFDNPLVNVYGKTAYMYRDFGAYRQGMYYEIGFNREVEIVESLTAGVDWNVGLGDSRYLNFLYGDCDYRDFDEEGEPGRWSSPDAGFGGTTLKLYLTWAITDWMSLGGTIAYTGVLNGSARDGLTDDYNIDYWEDGSNDRYPCDLLWGGISLNLTF